MGFRPLHDGTGDRVIAAMADEAYYPLYVHCQLDRDRTSGCCGLPSAERGMGHCLAPKLRPSPSASAAISSASTTTFAPVDTVNYDAATPVCEGSAPS